jgi:hypothetical protein
MATLRLTHYTWILPPLTRHLQRYVVVYCLLSTSGRRHVRFLMRISGIFDRTFAHNAHVHQAKMHTLQIY